MAKKNISIILIITLLLLTIHGAIVVYIDPFFHFHAPLNSFYYKRSATVERYTNDGIARHFDFNALITGVSVSEGFCMSEFDSLFGVKSEKIIYSGGTFKETGEGISRTLRSKPDTRIVLCSLFLSKLYQDKDHRRSDILDHPTYLYNDFFLDDVKYIFNKEVLFTYIYPMIKAAKAGEQPGVESYEKQGYLHLSNDDYDYSDGSWVNNVIAPLDKSVFQDELTESEIKNVESNVQQNIIDIAKRYPDTKMIYFIPPCSIYHYKQMYKEGSLVKVLQAEEIAINMMLKQENIEVYSFNDHTEILEDPKNYNDAVHYVGWVSSFILQNIANEEGKITSDNVDEFLDKEQSYLTNYNY
ncbi:hypothetical protein D6855_12735 [Butyrivibrio sp. CB08]|uniref:hypothetical protein n=1 Tax=Butyrivibrio sp. CB08 TaxID=2364879 RepID=UPI000EAA88DA|nr:hypothetical protein [Butyrivibrio sp. CB08]RKM57909.1 hypothetical protein D6855_12735 [Butyrivibrio sp. CB08]